MTKNNKKIKDLRFGFTGKRRKFGINYWRFFFYGINSISGSEQMFFIELEMLNPWLNPSEPYLSYKSRVSITAEDLQYALAGTQSAHNLETEELKLPSYCAIRVGKIGGRAKQICSYFSVREMNFHSKPFEIQIGNKFFSENRISGFLNLSKEEVAEHPEYLCDSGSVTWELNYEIDNEYKEGYKSPEMRWFPFGLKTVFTGKLNFDGVDYIVDPRKCCGYIERFWGKTMPEPWFHITAENLTSEITGKTLFNSSFAIKGSFNEKVSFLGKFEDVEIIFAADSRQKSYSAVWDCIQMPEAEDIDENLLHWSVSLHNKIWVIDIDVYCKIRELFNRSIELPDNSRRIMNLLEGGTGTGEVKLYKRVGSTLEQIEHANLVKVVCEFGHIEQGQF
ncbi:MAG: hypothetical protein K5681_10965 [Treponema sp.]|nr:hypothetical protein [Treponema sp.]